MTQRFSCKGAQIAQGGTTFTHNLGGDPTQPGEYEWGANLTGPTPGATSLYRTTLTSSTMIWCASGAAGTGDVFISRVYSAIK